jgi:hypothetical protein
LQWEANRPPPKIRKFFIFKFLLKNGQPRKKMLEDEHGPKMTAMPKEKMEMCPMMQKMKDQTATVKSLEERVDKLEKAVGKSK